MDSPAKADSKLAMVLISGAVLIAVVMVELLGLNGLLIAFTNRYKSNDRFI
jgi:hypothetical protein